MRPPPVLASLARRLARVVAQALGVVLLLFLILESGLAGDPAERALGERPSLERLGALRVELGIYRSFTHSLGTLALRGAPERFVLRPDGPTALRLSNARGEDLGRWELADRSLAGAIAELQERDFGDTVIEAQLADGSAQRPAAGLAVALRGTQLTLDSRRPAVLPWAEARPAWQRFLHQSSELLRFDFGRGLDGQPIGRALRERAGRSLAIALPGLLLGTLLALGAALLASHRVAGRLDRSLGAVAALAIAISGVSWVLVLRDLFASELGWFPLTAWDPPSLAALALPILIWGFLSAWPDFQVYRRILLDTLAEPHVVAARARGLPARWLWRRHILRSASATLLAGFVLALPFAVLGSVLLEQVFVIPGLGAYLVDAARAADAAVLRAATFCFALLYLVALEAGDWLSGRLDPRFAGRMR